MSNTKIPNAELGREAVNAIASVTGKSANHYVNKTPKYLSIKIETKHLSEKQIDKVAKILHTKHPDRFLAVYNNIAHPSSRGHTWTEDKVNVRFTQ